MRRRILSILLAAVLAGGTFFSAASAVTVLADTEAQEEAQSAEGEASASRAAELIREHKGYILEAIRTLRSYGLTPDAMLHTTGELLRLPFAARTAEQDGGAADAETETAQTVSESAKEAVADSLKEAAEDVGEHARKRLQEVIAEAMRAAGQKAAEMARGAIDRGANGVKELFTGAVDNE